MSMRSNFTPEETQAILSEHYPWAATAGPCEEGYYAGLVNSRANPHSLYTFEWWSWALGNSLGVSMHCAVVEAVYTRSEFS
jgi:hypothetical protein